MSLEVTIITKVFHPFIIGKVADSTTTFVSLSRLASPMKSPSIDLFLLNWTASPYLSLLARLIENDWSVSEFRSRSAYKVRMTGLSQTYRYSEHADIRKDPHWKDHHT
jgi:hypothetical protein